MKKILHILLCLGMVVSCSDGDSTSENPIHPQEEFPFKENNLSSSLENNKSSSSAQKMSSSIAQQEKSSSSEDVDSSSSAQKMSSSIVLQEKSSSSEGGVSSSSTDKMSSSIVLQEKSSSSEGGASSSSIFTSSSSSFIVDKCKTSTSDDCIYGQLYDERDGKIYKTVKIGEQEWMAENLDFECDSLGFLNRSVCHHDPDTCKKYGRLYFWGAALDSLTTGCGYGVTCSPSSPIQGICPEKWHIPTRAEIEILLKNTGENKNLMSSENWQSKCNGTDAYGFSVLPSGFYFASSGDPYSLLHAEAYIMLSDEYSKSQYSVLRIKGPASLTGCERKAQIYQKQDKADAVSVRCLKD